MRLSFYLLKIDMAIKIEECYTSSSCPPFILPKLMWLFKSPLDQNSIVIYQKFNGDFKSHINFEGKNEDKGMMCSITH
jgi:hypothetical protein